MRSISRMHAIVRCMAFLLSPLVVACVGGSRVAAVEIDSRGWQPGRSYEIVLHNDDTLSRRGIYFFVLHNSEFAHRYHTLPLSVTTIAPDSTFHTDGLYVHPVANERDEWHKLSWFETRVAYRLNATLSQRGDYRFVVANDALQTIYGVRAVGIEIMD